MSDIEEQREYYLRMMAEVGAEYRRYIAELQAENAALRELVRIMHSELVSCEDNGYVCGGHKFDKRVSELGVEP